MRWRLILAPLLILLILWIIWIDSHHQQIVAVRALIGLICLLSYYEFYRLSQKKGYRPRLWAGLLFLLGLPPLWHGVELSPFLQFLVSFSWLIFAVYLLFEISRGPKILSIESAALSFFGYGYVGLLSLALIPPAAISHPSASSVDLFLLYLLFLFSCAKGSDIAAFVFGKWIGKRKMAPTISPHKTWEGAIAGGLVGTGLGVSILRFTSLADCFDSVPPLGLLLFALCVTIASQVGDLVESAIKRWAGVKDSGRLLPSFGGILDMADSFFVSVPVAYVLSTLLTLLYT